MTKIKTVESRLFRVPLPEVLSDAKHGDHSHFELVTVRIELEDGSSGTGYTYTGGRGGHAIKCMIDHDMVVDLVGQNGDSPEEIADYLEWHIHYVGRGGIAAFAMSAIDIALWDIRCRKLGLPLWQVAGGESDRCNAYRGGIDLNFPLPKLLESVRTYLDEGYRAVKIKVGRDRLEEDPRRAVPDLSEPAPEEGRRGRHEPAEQSDDELEQSDADPGRVDRDDGRPDLQRPRRGPGGYHSDGE